MEKKVVEEAVEEVPVDLVVQDLEALLVHLDQEQQHHHQDQHHIQLHHILLNHQVVFSVDKV